MAAPHVAGAIALLKQASPESSVTDLLRTLKSAGREIRERRSAVTAVLIDVGRSIAALRSASAASSWPLLPAELTLGDAPPPGEGRKDRDEKDEEKKGQWKAITE